MNGKIKIGLLLDSYLLPAWKYKTIEGIALSDFASVSLVIKNESKSPVSESRKNPGPFVYRLHRKFDRFLFNRKPDYSEKINLKPLINNIPEIQINAGGNGNPVGFGTKEIDEIRKYNLDIILKYGYENLTGQILTLPRFGVWVYMMDNFDTEQEGTSGYFEVVTGNPVTVSALVKLGDGEEENQIITGAYEATCAYSVNLNRDKLFWRASLFTLRAIYGIFKYGESYLEGLKGKFRDDLLRQAGLRPPSSGSSIRYVGKALTILLSKIVKKIFYSDPFSWMLLFRIGNEGDFKNNSYASFRKLQPSKDRFWADPFVIRSNGSYNIFVEEFIYKKNKGHISVLQLDGEGNLQNVKRLIEKPYHMSYPFIFESLGSHYMIPETGENKTIDIYKCTGFPDSWVFVKSLMKDINAYDTTMFNYNGKWWLFALVDEINCPSGESPELFLFYADDFMSDKWISHPYNPIVSDIRTSRPAGNIFIHDGKIYRPSQDCSGRYGKAFNIIQILIINEKEYKEKEVIKVSPDWKKRLKGAHTFNFSGDFTIIDTYTFRRRAI